MGQVDFVAENVLRITIETEKSALYKGHPLEWATEGEGGGWILVIGTGGESFDKCRNKGTGR